jgi:hypothetical protein
MSTPSVRISDLRQVCGVLVDGVAEVFGQPARVALAVGRKHKPTNAHVEGIRAARERAAFDANGDHCAHM